MSSPCREPSSWRSPAAGCSTTAADGFDDPRQPGAEARTRHGETLAAMTGLHGAVIGARTDACPVTRGLGGHPASARPSARRSARSPAGRATGDKGARQGGSEAAQQADQAGSPRRRRPHGRPARSQLIRGALDRQRGGGEWPMGSQLPVAARARRASYVHRDATPSTVRSWARPINSLSCPVANPRRSRTFLSVYGGPCTRRDVCRPPARRDRRCGEHVSRPLDASRSRDGDSDAV